MIGSFKDGLTWATKLTPRKLYNAAQLTYSYQNSVWRGRSLHKGMPASVSIEPTTSCNLRCPECPSGLRSFTRPTGMMDLNLYRSTLDQLTSDLLYQILYFQGEPYLHKGFFDMVRYANEKKIYTATSTNAHYLDDERAEETVRSGLDRLIISIDGTTQDTYQSYRVGGDLNKVIEGTRNILKWKKRLNSKTPHTIFQFLVVGHNEHQIADVQKLAKELGVDELRLKTAQIYDYQNGSDLMPLDEKYSRYTKKKDGTYDIKRGGDKNCWKMWHSCVITWDGKVVPCCFDKDAHYSMGSLQQQSFSDIWTGHRYEEFRNNLIQSRDTYEMCKNCTEGVKVWS
ncbi:MAG TPA: radical SAM/SPASM domain-containing protein [Cytophagaceae bacterium]|jgi:radical SAM protein with 4Fe4S-binding SPASM domain|nr:radical SAM/SPASM domain-containing protein [Cytophagaceae bacterium]